MKKALLLGSILALGTVANAAQLNGVYVPIADDGTAKATLTVEVSGTVYSQKNPTLVVAPTSMATPNGSGFEILMKPLFVGEKAGTAEGTFVVQVMADNKAVPFTNVAGPTITLLNRGVSGETIAASAPTGVATDTRIAYALSELLDSATAPTKVDGTITITATPGLLTGAYADKTTNVVVEISGQNATPLT